MGQMVKIPIGLDINTNIALERLRLNPLSDLTEPPVYCRIGGSPAMTAGNFSMIISKAKSGKTFFLGSIVASMVSNSEQIAAIKGLLPAEQNKVLYFDTEQSAFHATRSLKRICSLTKSKNPANLVAYGLRPLTPFERLELIEEVISTTENIAVVAIDGVRDLLTRGINDEEEATSLTSKFLKWTNDYNIHIILILHQNKNDQNARGHIGTELLNKSETTIAVTKDQKHSIFVVSCDYSRDIAFDDFGFKIENGLPVMSELPGGVQLKAKNPQKISDQDHFQVLDSIFKDNRKVNRKELQDQIKHGFNNSFGDSHCRTFITHYKQKSWIDSEKSGRNVFYVHKRSIF